MSKLGIWDLPEDAMNKAFQFMAVHSDQRSLPGIQNYAMASTKSRASVLASTHAHLEGSIRAYLETRPVQDVAGMTNTCPLIPMYALIHRRAYPEIIARVQAYRLSPLVILRTLKFFTASFDLPVDGPHMPGYFDNLHLPEKSMSNAKACVFLMDQGFLDFVARLMQDYDRNTAVVSACIRFLYSITAVMKIVHEQIYPYAAIIKLIQEEHDAGGILWGYNDIMMDWKKKHAPPGTHIHIGPELLNAAQLHVNTRIVARGPQFRQDDIRIAAEKILLEASMNIGEIMHMQRDSLELPVRNIIQWLKASLVKDDHDDRSDRVLALAFLSRLCDLDHDSHRDILMEHGIAEVLIMGIKKNNLLAQLYRSMQSDDEQIVTKTQLAYYTLMTALLKTADLEPTIAKFAKQNAMQTVMQTLLLSMGNYDSIFSFYQMSKAYRPNFPNTFIPGIERAPYKTRCDGITPTFSVPELATVVACQLCLGGHVSQRSVDLSALRFNNFTLLKNLKFPAEPGRNLGSVLVTAQSTLRDTDHALLIPHHIEAMDDESFQIRQSSMQMVEYMIRKTQCYYAISDN